MEISRRFDIAVDIGILMVFIVTVYITKDFLSTIPLSIVLIYLLKPVYAGIFRLTRHEKLSSFFSLMAVFAVILAMLIGLSDVLLIEISDIQRSEALAAIRLTSISNDFILWMDSSLPAPVVLYVKGVGDIPSAIATWIIPITEAQLSSFVSSLPILFAESLIAIIFTYYMLIDGRHILDRSVELMPKTKRGIFRSFLHELDSIYTTFFTVYFTTAILSGSLAALGFYLLGIPYPLVWGTLVSLLALVPFPGPPLVVCAHGHLLLLDQGFSNGHRYSDSWSNSRHIDTLQHHRPATGFEDGEDTSYLNFAGLYRTHLRFGNRWSDLRTDVLWTSLGNLQDRNVL